MAGGRGRRGSRRPAGDVQGLGPGCRRPSEGRGPSGLVVMRRGGGVGAGAPTREATRPGKGADASEELEQGRRTEELKRGGGGEGRPDGPGEPERGASVSRYGAVPTARARCSVWRRRRAR